MTESEKRSAEFSEGTLVTLADGQGWWFPKPRLRFFPARDDAGKIVMGGGHTFDQRYRELYDQLVELDPDDAYTSWELRLGIACHLLERNYSLSDAELAELMPIDFDDETNLAMWRELAPVVAARPPKASPVGSNPD